MKPYAMAKIAGVKLAAAYREQYGFPAISLMPANLYGPGDNFDLETAHVVPALIRRFHEAKIWRSPSVDVVGDGHAAAGIFACGRSGGGRLFRHGKLRRRGEPLGNLLNVGTGEDLPVGGAGGDLIARHRGLWREHSVSTLGTPNGAPRKMLDVSRMQALGWQRAHPT